MRPTRRADPFAVLGLPAGPGLTDDDVRLAWRRVATATHPDRPDGGDPARFAAAAAAYTTLRTHFGRAEALADLARVPRTAVAGRWWSRVRRGRPARLALRIAVTAAASMAIVQAAGPRPATPALITGALTWLVLTARHDLAPRR
jgi:curved DNA-binding protein CbpA